jgi:hypothetical protein
MRSASRRNGSGENGGEDGNILVGVMAKNSAAAKTQPADGAFSAASGEDEE